MYQYGNAKIVSDFNCHTEGPIFLHARHADTLNTLKSWDAISSQGEVRAIIKGEPFQSHPERFEEPYNIVLDGYSNTVTMGGEFSHFLDLVRYAGELGVGVSAWNVKDRAHLFRIREDIWLMTSIKEKTDYYQELWPYLLDEPYAK